MTKPRRLWETDDVALMIRLREVDRSRWSEIDRALQRAAGSSCAKYESLRREKLPVHQKDAGGRVDISSQQETDRSARKEAAMRRDLTAELFGDPPPGFSALDLRRGGVQR